MTSIFSERPAADARYAHTSGQACWCRPYILRQGEKLIVREASRLVWAQPTTTGELVVHAEPEQVVA